MPDKPRYKRVAELERLDERDNVQARNTYEPGSEEYLEFYRRHPEWEDRDRQTRELSKELVGNPLDFSFFLQQIGRLAQWGSEDLINGAVFPEKKELSAERATEKVKGFTRHLGADLVRIGPLNPAFIYTHVGKTWHDPARKYGAHVALSHAHAISIAAGITPDLIKTGPVLSMASEIMRVYTQLAMISTTLAGYIRSLGYPARAHIVSNYQVLCIPIAIEGGMGELGRHGLMITKELGSCLKLTTVTTDQPLMHDPPIDIGVDEFCHDCAICADICPSGAIPRTKQVVRGIEKWRIPSRASLPTSYH